MEARQTYALRALDIGEIFDRAITIYVRHLVPLTLIVMTFVVPSTIAQGIFLRNQSVAALLDQMQHPAAVKPYSLGEFGAIMLIALVSLLLLPIVNDAVAVGVASVYNAKVPAYGRCFAAVLPRVLPLIGTAILFGLLIMAIYFGCAMAVVLVVIMGSLLVTVSVPIAVIFFVVAVILTLGVVALIAALLIGFAFATYASVLELAPPAVAIGNAFRRLFNRKEFRKVVLMGLAYFALNIGVATIALTVSALVEIVVRNTVVELTINAVITSMSAAFITVLLAVYYYDVRTRSEGLDLENDLARLTATP